MRTLVIAGKIGPAFRTIEELCLPCGERPNGRATISIAGGSTYTMPYAAVAYTKHIRPVRKFVIDFMLSLPAQDFCHVVEGIEYAGSIDDVTLSDLLPYFTN